MFYHVFQIQNIIVTIIIIIPIITISLAIISAAFWRILDILIMRPTTSTLILLHFRPSRAFPTRGSLSYSMSRWPQQWQMLGTNHVFVIFDQIKYDSVRSSFLKVLMYERFVRIWCVVVAAVIQRRPSATSCVQWRSGSTWGASWRVEEIGSLLVLETGSISGVQTSSPVSSFKSELKKEDQQYLL